MGHPMRLELIRVGLLVKLANCYTTKGAQKISLFNGISAFTSYLMPEPSL